MLAVPKNEDDIINTVSNHTVQCTHDNQAPA